MICCSCLPRTAHLDIPCSQGPHPTLAQDEQHVIHHRRSERARYHLSFMCQGGNNCAVQ
jgi:hypothetical protein